MEGLTANSALEGKSRRNILHLCLSEMPFSLRKAASLTEPILGISG